MDLPYNNDSSGVWIIVQWLGLIFLVGVFEIFRLELVFLDKIVKVGPVFSCQVRCLAHIAFSQFKETHDVALFELIHRLFERFQRLFGPEPLQGGQSLRR